MPYYNVANLLTITKTNMINEMPCGYWTLRTTGVRIWHQVSRRAHAEVSAALKLSHRAVLRSQQLQNLTILIVNLVAFWMNLHHNRCFQEHVRMLMQSLTVLCKAPGGAGSIWKYLEALVRATRLSRRFAFGFQTELHFADEPPVNTYEPPSTEHSKFSIKTYTKWMASHPLYRSAIVQMQL